MPKPTNLGRWAETAGGTPASNITEPSSGQKDTGWTNGQTAVSSFMNWWQQVIYDWIQWIDPLLTTNGGFTALANQHITVSGTGEFKHGELVLHLPAAMGATVDDDLDTDGWRFLSVFSGVATAWINPAAANQVVTFPIPLKRGDRITKIEAKISDTTGTHTITMRLLKSDNVNVTTQIGADQTSAGNGTNQTLTLSGLTETIDANEYFHVALRNNDATVTTHRVYGVDVTYDRP